MVDIHPSTIINSIEKYISVLKTKDNKYFFATQNNVFLKREETFSINDKEFEFFDIKFGHKRQLNFEDIVGVFLVSFPEEYTPPMGRDANAKELFIEIGKRYLEKIQLLDKSVFKYTVNDEKYETIFNLIRYNEILNYYDIKLDFFDKQILFFDEGITDEFLNNYKKIIFDKSGKLKINLSNAIILSFFDRQTQEYVLEDNDSASRFKKIKSIFIHLLNLSKEKTALYLENEKEEAIKDLKGIEKNYVVQNFENEIDKIRSLDIDKELEYIDNEQDLILYWPFTLDLSVGEFVLTTSPEKNKNTGKIIIHSVANTPFFNLYKVFKEYTKLSISLKTFEFLKGTSTDESIKKELIDKKLNIFENKKNEIFEFLNNELTSTSISEVKEDILKLKEEINSAIELYKKEITVASSLRDILKYWPVYLYPIPEELIVE